MPRHEVSVVNLQLGIKASKYLIHQPLLRIREPYFIYQKAARALDPSFSLGRRFLEGERNSSKFRIRKGTNLCSKICLLYLPFGWASSGGWLKLSTGDTNTVLRSKFNREDKLRRNPTSLSRSLSRLLIHFVVRRTTYFRACFDPAGSAF